MNEKLNLIISLMYPFIAVLAPFLLMVYLLGTKITLTIVNKKILNNGLIVSNCVSLLMFCLSSIFPFNWEKTFFSFENVDINLGIVSDTSNVKFLIFSSLIFLIMSIYLKNYFCKKTQFYFIKQRFYVFFSLLICCVYLLLLSSNLFEALIFWMLSGVIVFIFSYFDLFRVNANYNIERFHRIYLIGDISFFAFVLILFKNASISGVYANLSSLNFAELETLIEYSKGTILSGEYIAGIICLILAVSSRLCLFPLSCFYSFFCGVSNILFNSVVFGLNAILGSYILYRLASYINYNDDCIYYCVVFAILGILISILSLFFEKNIKIIFGYILSVINALFFIGVLKYDPNISLYCFFALNLIVMLILSKLFIKDKVNIKTLVKKQKGFFVERAHIFVFEELTHKISVILKFIDEKIVQNILSLIIIAINYLVEFFDFKPQKKDILLNARIILIIFSLFAFFAIFLTLFTTTWEV